MKAISCFSGVLLLASLCILRVEADFGDEASSDDDNGYYDDEYDVYPSATLGDDDGTEAEDDYFHGQSLQDSPDDEPLSTNEVSGDQQPYEFPLGKRQKPSVLRMGKRQKPSILRMGKRPKPPVFRMGKRQKPSVLRMGKRQKPSVLRMGKRERPPVFRMG